MVAAQTRPAGLAAALTLVVGLVLAQAGVDDGSGLLASSIALLIVGGISLLAPRSTGLPRPVGLTAAGATVLVWVASLAGVTIDAATATAIVTVPAIVVSIFTPRVDEVTLPDEGNVEASIKEPS